ncbi:MAG TPA: hypothetical protein DCS63_05260 [Elusimicrobia bacterium]|nr:hypothetical protein [Elusimicrobiota bacterium]
MHHIFLCGIILNFGLLAGLCGCRPAVGSAGARGANEGLKVRAMTFNIRLGGIDDGINSWENRREMVFDVFRSHKPDIAGLQEPFRFQLDQIRQSLPHYGEIGVGREDGAARGEYSPILYDLDRFTPDESGTFWFSDTPEVAGSSHWGNAYIRICSWARFIEKRTGGAFYVYNVHLDNESQISREKSVALLVKRIMGRTHQDPFLVMGDFNVTEDNPIIGYLSEKKRLEAAGDGLRTTPLPMTDTFRAVGRNKPESGTFHEFKGMRDGDKIDYIFSGPGVKALGSEILYDARDGRFPSDHFPVSALLELPPGLQP